MQTCLLILYSRALPFNS